MGKAGHWQEVYGRKRPAELSWYADHLERSLTAIRSVASVTAKIIDIGGGASTLVDDLLAGGYRDVTVLDISATALDVSKARLGENAVKVTWIQGDVTNIALPEAAYDLWHDRAVFHFHTDAAERRAYVNLAARSLRIGGHAVIAIFAPDGPVRCSGLDVLRYDAQTLGIEFGPTFLLKEEARATHRTPSGAEQSFIHCIFQRIKVG